LRDKSLYAPSVHCSYYGCFQLLKFTINNFFGVDYEKLSQLIASNALSTHSYIIKYVSDEIRTNLGRDAYREFNNKIKDLKNFREESDYDNVEISLDKGAKAYSFANEIRIFLNKNFHV
jgi:hypothetical protein